MDFRNESAQVFVPDRVDLTTAFARTTHLAIGAHHDDVPIMALDGIGKCFDRLDQWFFAVTVTDGGNSPRSGSYAQSSDREMQAIREREENEAATVGRYSGAIQLGYSSTAAKDGSELAIVNELAAVISATRPNVIYTHNLADKHDTHVAVSLRTIAAIRSLPPAARPQDLYGCEVWRDLDWMLDGDKVIFDVTDYSDLAQRLLSIYDSQVSGGKRYDRAATGRRLAHATFLDSHEVDSAGELIYGMDLSPLIEDTAMSLDSYVARHISRMKDETSDRIARMGGG